jgi:hypothetical protein
MKREVCTLLSLINLDLGPSKKTRKYEKYFFCILDTLYSERVSI